MNHRQLGTSDLYVSEVGFGCMSLRSSEEDNISLLHTAIENGINFFDTADLYDQGMNEVLVGKALKEKRKDAIIATKVGNQWRPDGSGWDWNPRKEYIFTCVEESLKRLQTDYIDLYQLHGGTIDDPIDETIEAFEVLKQQGKIRYYGISSIRPNVIREYVKRSSIVSVMMQYSLFDRRPEETCLQLLNDHNIGVLSRGALAQGLLVNKPAKEYLNYSQEEIAKTAETVKSLSGNHRTASQIAIQFVLNHPAITSAVIGIRTKEQLEDVVQTSKTGNLTSKELKLLRDVTLPNVYEQHR